MTKLIFKLEQTLITLFKVQKKLDKLDLYYDEDLICDLKNDFINKYSEVLTKNQIDYIINI